jgi:Lrp/AsnC family transcriptional regulator, leucine-responsive regulatory protein
MIKLDIFDLKLLAEIQKNSDLSQSELGARVNLSAAAVNRRLKRLSDEKVIKRYVAVIAPETVGYSLTIVTQIEVEREQIDVLDEMKQNFEACPQVQQCYYVTGEWDFILVLTVRDMAQYTELTRQIFFRNNVRRFQTLVALDRVKAGLEVPIDVDGEMQVAS